MEDATINVPEARTVLRGQETRSREELRIKGIAFALGSYAIASEEKARTIPGVDPAAEAEKLIKGLHINATSVAAENEDTITVAARAVLNLVHMHGIDPTTIDTLVLATETPNDISKNNAIEVIRMLNELGYGFNPKIVQHVQSACTSGVTALASMAMNGMNGRALIVTTDDAKYRYGTPADGTGGFGATATLVEKSENGGGFRVHAEIGHDRADVDDFTKRVEEVIDELSGLALVNKYPAVYGKYSEYEYMLRVYRSIREAVGANRAGGIEGGSFLDNYTIISHIPFPSMPEKAAAYLVRHMMRVSEELRKDVYADKAMGGVAEQFLDGFKDLEMQFDFVSRFAGLYYKLDLIREGRDRLKLSKIAVLDEARKDIEYALVNERLAKAGSRLMRLFVDENGLRARASRKVEKTSTSIQRIFEEQNSKDLKRLEVHFARESAMVAESMRGTLKSIENDFPLSEDWKGILSRLDASLSGFGKNGASNTVDAFLDAFGEGISEIDRFMDADSMYVRQLRKTAAFKRILEELHIDEAVEISKETGNLYTGSVFEGLISFVRNAYNATEAVMAGNATEKQKKLVNDLSRKKILFVGFGSGDESYSVVLTAEAIREIGAAVSENVEYELARRKFIKKEEYERLRNGEGAPSSNGRLMRYKGFTNAVQIKEDLRKELQEAYRKESRESEAAKAKLHA